MKALLLSLLSLAAATMPLAAQDLWNGTKMGMSEAELRAKVPGLEVAKEPAELFDGTKAKLMLPKVEIGGESFVANFYFKEEKLLQVMLTLPNKQERTFDQLVPLIDTLVADLGKKHGKPTETKRDDNPVRKFASYQWTTKTTRLSVNSGGVDRLPAFLTITYQGVSSK